MDESGLRYYSGSKKEFVKLVDMPTPHLSNAAKRATDHISNDICMDGQEANVRDLLVAMIDELARRVPARNLADGIRTLRGKLEQEGYHYPNELLCEMSELIGEDFDESDRSWKAGHLIGAGEDDES